MTIGAGNVPFEYRGENARYTLELSGGTDDVTVYEGASRLEKVERRRD